MLFFKKKKNRLLLVGCIIWRKPVDFSTRSQNSSHTQNRTPTFSPSVPATHSELLYSRPCVSSRAGANPILDGRPPASGPAHTHAAVACLVPKHALLSENKCATMSSLRIRSVQCSWAGQVGEIQNSLYFQERNALAGAGRAHDQNNTFKKERKGRKKGLSACVL